MSEIDAVAVTPGLDPGSTFTFCELMDVNGLDRRLIERWQLAADELSIRVTAPATLRDVAGKPFRCEAFVHDFGSQTGAVIVSPKTERRVRQQLRGLGDAVWVCVSPSSKYVRKDVIDELCDWGWFGTKGEQPDWYE